MPFTDRAHTQDEAPAVGRRAGLIEVRDDARIEQGGRLEGILVKKVGTDQPPLFRRELHVCRNGIFHVIGARIEHLLEVPVPALEVLEDIVQLGGRRFGVEREDALDDVIGSRLVGRVEVSRFRRRLELAHDDSRGIRAQLRALSLQKLG